MMKTRGIQSTLGNNQILTVLSPIKPVTGEKNAEERDAIRNIKPMWDAFSPA